MKSAEKKSRNSKSLQQKAKEMDSLVQTSEGQISLFKKESRTLSAIFNHTEVGFLIVGTDLKIKWANKVVNEWMGKEGLKNILGIKYKTLLNSFGKILPDPGPIEHIFSSSEVLNFKFRMGNDLNQTNIFMTAMPILSSEEKVEEVLVMLRDLTNLETLRKSQKELKQSEKLTKTLFKISNAVNTTFSLDDLFKSIHNALANIIDVTNLAIGIYDSNKDTISYPYYADETNDVYHEIKDVGSSGIFAAEVINLKNPLFLSKNEIIARKKKEGRKPIGSVPEQWLGVPLTMNNEVIGVIVVQSYSNPELYSKKDADILMAISDQVATAITKKQSEDAQKKSEKINKVLFAISNAVNTTNDLFELYKSIHKSLGEIIDLTNFIIGLHNKKDNTILFEYYIDQFDDSQGKSMSIEKGSVGGGVIRSGEPVFLKKDELLKKNKKIKAVGTWAKTWMGVPLKTDNEVIGYMATQSYNDPDKYSQNDLAIFSSVSDQVALAIARKRAQDAEIKNKAINKALFSISNAVNTTDNLNALYKSIHKSLEHIIDATNFFIATYDRTTDILSFPYDVDIIDGSTSEIRSASKSSSLTSEVILKGNPLFFKKQEMIDRAKKMNLEVAGTPAEQWLGVPLKTKEEIIGAIVIQSYDDPNIYEQKDMDLLIAVSDQVALAIERKRAEDAQKKSEKLNKVLFAISNAVNTTENLTELYKSIYKSLNQLRTLPNFFICIVDKGEKKLYFPLYIDEHDSYDPLIPDGYDENNPTITIDIIKNKKPIFLNQKELARRHRLNKLSGTKSLVWLGVPLIIRGTVIGVMAVQHYSDPNYFTHDDVNLFTAVSDQIALAIDRKRSQEIILEHKENLEKKVKDRTKELTKAKIAAEAAAKSKGEFLANMSHEIRTPINGIMGMAEIALGNKLDNNLQPLLKTIDTEANSLLGIVNQILDFSKIEAGKLILEEIPFNLRNTFEQACSSLAINVNNEKVEFVCFLAPDMPVELIGDPGRFRQILINLISNAIKFTHQGEIFVKGEKVKSDESSVEVRFLIKDTGIGIAVDKQKEIFEGFSQADGSTTREYGGTGLGTTISKQLAELMDGEIGLESLLGKGSTFWFKVKFKKQTIKKQKGIKEKVDFKGLRILILDSNKTNRYVFVEYLKSFGASTVIADGEKGMFTILDKSMEDGEPIDVIIADLKMSKEGFELSKKIKSQKGSENLPIILLASSGNIGDANKCKDIGIDSYLLKPVKRDELKIAIDNVVRQSNLKIKKDKKLITRHTIAEEKISNKRILLVEDYATNQKIAMRHLNSEGYHVTLAENGQAAVDLYKKKHFDLVLMDIQMPIMDGYKATHLIREYEAKLSDVKVNDSVEDTPCHMPIIAMTAHAFEGYKDKCLSAKMDDFITKPIRKKQFLLIIKKWLAQNYTSAANINLVNDKTNHTLNLATDSTGNKNITRNIPLDYEKALDEFGNDNEFLNEVLGDFLSTVETQLATMEKAIALTNFKILGKEAHSIKGGAANLIAKKFSNLAYGLELTAKSKSLGKSHELFKALKNEFYRLKEYAAKLYL